MYNKIVLHIIVLNISLTQLTASDTRQSTQEKETRDFLRSILKTSPTRKMLYDSFAKEYDNRLQQIIVEWFNAAGNQDSPSDQDIMDSMKHYEHIIIPTKNHFYLLSATKLWLEIQKKDNTPAGGLCAYPTQWVEGSIDDVISYLQEQYDNRIEGNITDALKPDILIMQRLPHIKLYF